MSIIVHNLTYMHPDREELFAGISFSVGDGEKASLIGDNGSGKSTLIKILSGELSPASGSFFIGGRLWTVPQHFGQYDSLTVAGALGIEEKLSAIEAITNGSADEKYYETLADDWGVGERARAALNSAGLPYIDLTQGMDTLSGGEKTKVFVAGIAVHDPGVILMDEPTNHLDAGSRAQLYRTISRSRATVLVVSHDRQMLNLIDTTLELRRDGIRRYGGNYDFYKAARDTQENALREQLDEKQKALRTAERKAREAIERKERSDARGLGKQLKERTLPGAIDKYRGKAEQSTAKLKDTHAEKIASITADAQEIKSHIAKEGKMKLAFDDAALHEGKVLVDAREVNFSYPGGRELWREPLSFLIRSGERIALEGANGSGKTTLLRIILGEEEPTAGKIWRAGSSFVYIDQEYSLIDDSLTVIGQLEKFNRRNLPGHFLRTELDRFLFPAPAWDKLCGTLSGGEKMRLTLCCLQVANDTPDIFVLDEPTNNLDIRSMEILTSAVSGYRGTVLAISHDRAFLDDIGVTGSIELKNM